MALRPSQVPKRRGSSADSSGETRHQASDISAELHDQQGEAQPVQQAWRSSCDGRCQSSTTTRWLETAKIHDTPKPAVREFSRRTSGLGANTAPCRSS